MHYFHDIELQYFICNGNYLMGRDLLSTSATFHKDKIETVNDNVFKNREIGSLSATVIDNFQEV